MVSSFMHPDTFPHTLFSMENYHSRHHLGAHGQNKRRVWKIECPCKLPHGILKCGSSFSFIILGADSAHTPHTTQRRARPPTPPSRAVWGRPGPSGTVWGRLGPLGPSRTVCWGCLGCRAVWGRLVPSRTVWGRLGPSGAVWGRLGPSGPSIGARFLMAAPLQDFFFLFSCRDDSWCHHGGCMWCRGSNQSTHGWGATGGSCRGRGPPLLWPAGDPSRSRQAPWEGAPGVQSFLVLEP